MNNRTIIKCEYPFNLAFAMMMESRIFQSDIMDKLIASCEVISANKIPYFDKTDLNKFKEDFKEKVLKILNESESENSEKSKEIIRLRYEERQTYADIATIFDRSAEAISNQAARAIRKLRKFCERDLYRLASMLSIRESDKPFKRKMDVFVEYGYLPHYDEANLFMRGNYSTPECKLLRFREDPNMLTIAQFGVVDFVSHLQKRCAELEKENTELKVQLGIMDPNEAKQDVPVIPIETLNLSYRPYQCLKRNGINSTRDIIETSKDRWLNIRNFGRKSYREICEVMEKLGYTMPVITEDEFVKATLMNVTSSYIEEDQYE